MIIFYNKTTGDIIGSVRGRVHQPEELKMWIGDPQETDRIIIEWKPEKWHDKDGNIIPNDCLDACDENGELLAQVADFAPDCHKDIRPLVENIDSNPSSVHTDHKIDVATKTLRLKHSHEIEKEKQQLEAIRQQEKKREQERNAKISLIKDPKQPLEKRFEALLELDGVKEAISNSTKKGV